MEQTNKVFVIVTQLSSLVSYQQLLTSITSLDILSKRKKLRAFKQQLGKELLGKFLAKHLDLKVDVEKLWGKEENGRPYLTNFNLDFNLSHSGDWLAIIIAPATPLYSVAIDIESKQTRNFLALLQSLGEQGEKEFANQALVRRLPTEEQRFYYLWCGREALTKVRGGGIKDFSLIKSRVNSLQELEYTFSLVEKGKLIFIEETEFYLCVFISYRLHGITFFFWQDEDFIEFKSQLSLVTKIN
ncbi:4'-phosphopantetheinyl transferase family protein [Psittacicella gerlachiana]|uniref:4'-phosphopantetheinyl transferase domain-containing protein n=1 Tax=Psittacicella gerlachiana TaxID=2028574 RepID=A0A3A1YHU2_9GAMM|nr:4'-phosphopantetheinyl transferase superfamily protein [Psittacicella gerlachiana]RIY36819.1 hypothetical protein CKF59_02070 [Psittacicella gerlachiana]